VFNAFVQDELTLISGRLKLTMGTKLEHNDYTGFEIIPDVRLAWTPKERHFIWISVSRALRVPSRNDTNLVVNFGTPPISPLDLNRLLGNPNFDNEALIAYQAGYRASFSDHFSLDVAAYYNDYDHLQTTEPGTPFLELTPPPHSVQPFMYQNEMNGETHGLEIAANWKILDRWTLSPGYALEQLHMRTNPGSLDVQSGPFVEGASPRHSAQLRSRLDLPHNLTWEAAAYFVDRLTHQGPASNVTIPSYTRVDTGLMWRPRERILLGVFGQNLVHDHHVEFEDVDGSMQSGQIKRSVYAKFSLQF
jgi:iron complex outermembrane recepter protein